MSGPNRAVVLALWMSVGWASHGQKVCSNRQTATEIDTRIDTLIAKMTVAERIAQLQDRAPAIQRLGLPAYNWWNEGLHGLARNGYATVFPQAIGLAATWDTALMHAVGDTVAMEARAKFYEHGSEDSPRYGGLSIWSPNINIFRDPRWGRGQETYGEDPFLTATLGTQFVRGLQGDDPFYRKADATPKHFAAHSGPEEGRDSFNAVVSSHDLEDTYLTSFHALTVKADAAALMCSYNEIDGTPSCASSANLQGLVRDRWGFKGYVVSDCDAVGDIAAYHHYAVDSAHGASEALNAGVDLDCGDTYAALEQGLALGLTTEAKLSQALHRLLLARVQLGMMDPQSCLPFKAMAEDAIDSPRHRALARQAAEESIVLLKNEGVLPLRGGDQKLAVIGPTADMLKVLEANYHGTASHPVTPLDGIRKIFPTVTYAQGSLLAEGVSAPIPRTALRLTGRKDSTTGLTAEYFEQPSVEGTPRTRTHVEKIDFDLDRVSLVPGSKAAPYAARWSGFLRLLSAGSYGLRVNVERCWDCKTHDGFRLFVDGKLLIENHGNKGEKDQAVVNFSDTRPHALRLEYLHTGEDEGVALEWLPPSAALLDEAVAAARDVDVIVALVGLSPDLEGEALQLKLKGFNGGDRTSLDLPETQRELLRRLGALHKPLAIVLTSGSAVALGPAADGAAAILEAWYPGEAGGEALARVLSGTVNPSGRLPVTFFRSVDDLPAFTDYSMAHRTYRYFDGPVLFPFGFGLSYSRFAYSPVRLSGSLAGTTASLTATVQVTNESRRNGIAVAELYVRPPQQQGAPRLTLQGIQRVSLHAGQTRELSFPLTPEQMSTVDASGVRALRSGTYRVFVGGAQPEYGAAGAAIDVREPIAIKQ